MDRCSLAALLDVRANELLRVLFEHFVDFVENRVDVIVELLVPLFQVAARAFVDDGLVGFGRVAARVLLARGFVVGHLPSVPRSSSPVAVTPERGAVTGVLCRHYLRQRRPRAQGVAVSACW